MAFATNLKFKCYLFSNLILWDIESETGWLVGSVIQFVTDCPRWLNSSALITFIFGGAQYRVAHKNRPVLLQRING